MKNIPSLTCAELAAVLETIPQVGELRGLTFDALARRIAAGMELRAGLAIIAAVDAQLREERRLSPDRIGEPTRLRLDLHPAAGLMLGRALPPADLSPSPVLGGMPDSLLGVPVTVDPLLLPTAGHWQIRDDRQVLVTGTALHWLI